jgi:glycosyltransferase involved in cell wall biosynthesis
VVSYHDGNLAARVASPLGVPKLTGRRLERALAFEREVYSGASAIFTMSGWLANSFVKDFGVPASKVHPVYAGINMPEPPVKEPGTYSRPSVVFVGKDFPRKGGEILLQAFAKVRREIRDATLTLVGPQLENLPDGVTCAGYVSKTSPAGLEKLSEIYRSASLFVLPSLYEPFGIAFCEAMAHGLPCIGTNICAMPEIIDANNTGLLVPPRDADSLASAMIQLLKDEKACEQLGRAGRQRYEALFTWNKVTGRILSTLKSELHL